MKTKLLLFFIILFTVLPILSQRTYVPDDGFEQVLIDLGYDDVLDDYVTNINISSILELNIQAKGILELTGIEGFVSLEKLNFRNNEIQKLDLTDNHELLYLDCSYNKIDELILTNNIKLIELIADNNELTSLDLTKNVNLEILDFSDGSLNTGGNNLTEIDISENLELTKLNCSANSITNLDVSKNTKLIYLSCAYNPLKNLNVKNGNNKNFTFFSSYWSQVSCIKVDDAEWSRSNWSARITNSGFSEYCSDGGNQVIPDSNLEQALIDLGIDSIGELDGFVPTEDIINITDLDLSNRNIEHIGGLKAFTSLKNLNLSNNLMDYDCQVSMSSYLNWDIIEVLDVSNNLLEACFYVNGWPNLKELDCSNNKLTRILIKEDGVLEKLICNNNLIVDIDSDNNNLYSDNIFVSKTLNYLDCSNNNFESFRPKFESENFYYLNAENSLIQTVDVKNGNNKNITTFNISNNPNLICVGVDDIEWSENNWVKDETTSFSGDCTLGVVSTEFETFLISKGYDKIADKKLLLSPITEVTRLEILQTPLTFLSSSSGLKHFKNLEELEVFDNPDLTYLDVEDLIKLRVLNSSENPKLSSLILPDYNTNLQRLNCYANKLNSLNVSRYSNLIELQCQVNFLSNIDVSNNRKLKILACNNNYNITSLNVTNNQQLESLYCYDNKIVSLNLSQLTGLEILNCRTNPIQVLDISNNKNLIELNVSNAQLTSINLNEHINLRNLYVSNNTLTELDVINNTLLKTLNCENNQIEDLDLSKNSYLTNLNTSNNALKSLNVKNGNNHNIIFEDGFNSNGYLFNAIGNPDLLCIEVDDVNYSSEKWTLKNTTSIFKENCNYPTYTYVPDNNFEQVLINQGYDDVLDDYVLTENISSVINLTLGAIDVADLTGISGFESLSYLDCTENSLTTLDVSKNKNLITLICYDNQLSELIMVDSLQSVYCYDNNLSVINTSDLNNLKEFQCYNNLLNSLDLSSNVELKSLECGNNPLSELDVSYNINLESVFCYKSNIESLDLSNNIKLTKIVAQENDNLSELLINNGNNVNLTQFSFIQNPKLTCIQVDEVNFAETNFIDIDEQSYYSLDCSNNSPIVSNIQITGTLTEGEKLIASYDYSDVDTDVESGSTYKWYVSEDAAGTNKVVITDAITQTYTLITEDIGKYISFEVTPNDGTEFGESVESELQGPIEQIFVNTAPTVSLVTFSGTLTEAELLTASYEYSDIDADVESGSTYKWYVSEDVAGTNKAAITDAITQTYTLTTEDIGKYISFEVTPNDGTDFGESVESELQGPIEMIFVNTAPTVSNVSISGILTEGEELLASYEYSDIDTDVESGSTYKWYVSEDATGTNKVAITGAITQTYTLTTEDIGKYISFEVTPNDGTDFGLDLESTLQGPIEAMEPIVNIPDANMKVALLADNTINTNEDSEIQVSEAEKLTGDLVLNGLEITEITGIEYFINITKLNLSSNNIVNVDLSKNTKLLELNLFFNSIANIDLSKNVYLNRLIIANNKLAELDLSNNEELEYLSSHSNLLSNLDLSLNIMLTQLFVSKNDLESIDLSNNIRLSQVGLDQNKLVKVNLKNGRNGNLGVLNLSNNPNLVCVEVDNVAYAITNFTSIDDASVFSLNCNNTAPVASNIQVSGTLKEGELLTASYEYSDVDADVESGSTFKWYVSEDAAGTNKVSITDAITQSYTLTTEDIGKYISFEVTPNDGTEFGESVESELQGPIEMIFVNTAPTVSNVSITGTLKEGALLTASYEYSDVDADVEAGSTYKWYISEDATGTNKIAITDAITQTYTLTIEDIGKYISFEVTPNDGTEFGESVESELQGPIEMIFVNTAPTVSSVIVSGTLTEGELLTASYEYSDVDADVEAGSTYKWYISEDATGTNKIAITDAITQTYTLTIEDIGKYISFEVTPNDGTEFGESVESELQGPIEMIFVNTAPTVSNVSITGILKEGALLTASYEYSDVDADVESGSTYKWYVSEDVAGTNKAAITDAITQTYTLTTEDIGKYISFEVTPNDGTEFGESLESELQGPIEMIFVNTAPTVSNVSITGTLKEGELLTASYEYSDVNADVESGSTFKWYVSEDAVGTNKVAITDAITQSYTLTTEDIGKYISFEVTPNDGTEFGESVESELQGPIEVKEPIVNIPDANLKTALVADVLINTNGDSEIQVLEAEVFTGTVVASELEISDLTGIEAFINITGLDVRKNNNIASVDLSKNTKLTWLSIDQNKLTALDVSTLTSLDALYAGDNKIKSIDVSNNILLKKLWLNINELTAIDISKNTILEVLELDWNFGLTSIDFTTNLSLSKIHLWKTAISTLDVSFLLELEKLYVSETNLTTIDLTNNTKLIDFRASDSKISSFDFSENTELERIDVKGCNLTDLDISKNTKLKILLANENSLTGINTTKNTELNEMVVNNNAIINVDINNNYSLTKLLLNDNKLERTYLINGNNAAITEFDITNNPDLTCISVDNVDWSTTNWINKDAVASYNTDCSAEWEVYTEDEEFNDAIASVSGVDSDGDGVVTYEEAQAFTGDLDLSGLNISDITGLEAFTNAASINISGNVITDISNLLNANTVIVSSRTTGEKRTVKRKATSLQKLNVANNLINEIDLSEVSSLTELNVSNNKLMYLNLNNNSNTSLIKVDATGNLELTCIQVDSVEDASNNADWKKDDIASYNTFCPKSVLTTENYLKESISMYPNPATTNIQITITSDIALRTVEIYNSIGKKVLESNKSLVDVKSLANGIYFVRVITNKGFINRKLIKK